VCAPRVAEPVSRPRRSPPGGGARSAIVNTGAIVSHDCRIGDYAHVAPGAILAGGVEIEEGTLVGMGATVNIGVRTTPRRATSSRVPISLEVRPCSGRGW
jgi:acyl-[acyl carrier protein]--UDP-N-acetylglucosamine O-acyltransferase